MNAKRTRFRISHSLPRLQRRVVFRERESRTGICSHQIKLGHFILFPVVFGKEVVEKRDLRGGKD